MIYGFKHSSLDGTEFIFEENLMKIPDKFSYIKVLPNVLDQGSSPICVPCSISCYINWKNYLNKTNIDFNIEKVFKEAGGQDEGISFKDMLNYTKMHGKIKYYAMVMSPEQLKRAIIINGPCIGGLPVKNSIAEEFWNGDNLEGGHAIAIIGYDENGFIIRNSWGNGYGVNGYSHLSYDDFKKFYEIWTLI